MALGAQQGYQLPMQRIQDVSNIYGTISGAMPGSPTQPFQPTPLATGIGGGLSAAYMLGMGRDNTATAAPAATGYLGGASSGYTGNPGQMNMGTPTGLPYKWTPGAR